MIAAVERFNCHATTKSGSQYAPHPVDAEDAAAAARHMAELIWRNHQERVTFVEIDGHKFGIAVSEEADGPEFIPRPLTAA